MIAHQQLGALVHDDVGGRHAALLQMLQLGGKLVDVQRHTVADDVGGVGVEHAGRQLMQGKLTIVADNGMARIGAALEADDHIGLLRQQIGDLALTLVAPVGAYDRFHHIWFLLPRGFAHWPFPAGNPWGQCSPGGIILRFTL